MDTPGGGHISGLNEPEIPKLSTTPLVDGPPPPLPLKPSLSIIRGNPHPVVAPGWLVFIRSPESPSSPAGLRLLRDSSLGRRVPATACDPWLPEATLESDRDILPTRDPNLAARRSKKLSLPTGCVGSKSTGAAGSSALTLTARPACGSQPSAGRRGSSVVMGLAGAVLTAFLKPPISSASVARSGSMSGSNGWEEGYRKINKSYTQSLLPEDVGFYGGCFDLHL